jgi:alpha 1,2-mannosyltransferase
MYYTNFELTSLAFWRSDAYRDFFDFLDKSNGIYMHRYHSRARAASRVT